MASDAHRRRSDGRSSRERPSQDRPSHDWPSRDRAGDRVVELATFPTRFEAQVVTAMLESHGIRSMIAGMDSAGYLPNIGFAGGIRVEVLASELEEARDLLASDPGPDPV